jgi:hypothetical protein
MRTRLPGEFRPRTGAGISRPALQPVPVPALWSNGELGPFVVRRFVDFALTESMMCRCSA